MNPYVCFACNNPIAKGDMYFHVHQRGDIDHTDRVLVAHASHFRINAERPLEQRKVNSVAMERGESLQPVENYHGKVISEIR